MFGIILYVIYDLKKLTWFLLSICRIL